MIATNASGRAGSLGDGFLTCPSVGPCPPQPNLPGESLWNLEAAEREGREAPRLEAERQAAAELPAKEAAERAAREQAIREAGERAGRETAERAASARSPKCVVPRLAGDSLNEARHALARAHCRMGRLTEPRGYSGPLVVVRQSARSDAKLAAGSRVALTLRRAPKR